MPGTNIYTGLQYLDAILCGHIGFRLGESGPEQERSNGTVFSGFSDFPEC